MAARNTELELRIQRQLTPAKYGQLVKDLQGTLRAFDLLEKVAPSLLRELVREQSRRAHGGSLGAAHAALEDLIAEVREHKREIVRPARAGGFVLIRGGRR
jgi:hypothetical protein